MRISRLALRRSKPNWLAHARTPRHLPSRRRATSLSGRRRSRSRRVKASAESVRVRIDSRCRADQQHRRAIDPIRRDRSEGHPGNAWAERAQVVRANLDDDGYVRPTETIRVCLLAAGCVRFLRRITAALPTPELRRLKWRERLPVGEGRCSPARAGSGPSGRAGAE